MTVKLRRPPCTALRAFRRDTEASSTVEHVIWLPFFLLIIAAIVDLSLVLTANAGMWDAARDGARRMAMHQMSTTEAADYVRSRIPERYEGLSVVADDSGDDAVIHVTVPMEEAAIFSILVGESWGSLEAQVIMVKEPV